MNVLHRVNAATLVVVLLMGLGGGYFLGGKYGAKADYLPTASTTTATTASATDPEFAYVAPLVDALSVGTAKAISNTIQANGGVATTTAPATGLKGMIGTAINTAIGTQVAHADFVVPSDALCNAMAAKIKSSATSLGNSLVPPFQPGDYCSVARVVHITINYQISMNNAGAMLATWRIFATGFYLYTDPKDGCKYKNKELNIDNSYWMLLDAKGNPNGGTHNGTPLKSAQAEYWKYVCNGAVDFDKNLDNPYHDADKCCKKPTVTPRATQPTS